MHELPIKFNIVQNSRFPGKMAFQVNSKFPGLLYLFKYCTLLFYKL